MNRRVDSTGSEGGQLQIRLLEEEKQRERVVRPWGSLTSVEEEAILLALELYDPMVYVMGIKDRAFVVTGKYPEETPKFKLVNYRKR